MILKGAAERYLDDVGASQDLVNMLNSHFYLRKVIRRYYGHEQEDKRHLWEALTRNEKQFREDRAFIWDVLEKATIEYFIEYAEFDLHVELGAGNSSAVVRVVVKATWKFATMLQDARTAEKLRKYWNGRI